MSVFPFANSSNLPNLNDWFQMRDVERKDLAQSTWIPLKISKSRVFSSTSGHLGFRKEYHSIEALIIPYVRLDEFSTVDWHSIQDGATNDAWVHDGQLIPPGCHYDDLSLRYPVIEQSFDCWDIREWMLFQELEMALRLRRVGDSWIRPSEDDVEVAKLERDEGGYPECLLIKAEFLRDYLCAKSAFLLVGAFGFREGVEEEFEGLDLTEERQEREFPNGCWDGVIYPIHEGGHPYGMDAMVLHLWRESVDPTDDVPIMPHPTQETAPRSESYTARHTGRRLLGARSRIWHRHVILPAERSPRVKGDHVAARVPFLVENQQQNTLAGDELQEHRGWLWFKPSVIRALLQRPKTIFRWCTNNTGEIGPSSNHLLHFGINEVGLINVLGYKMGETPEWIQRLWVTHNVAPEGGLSQELHMSQNLGSPARTRAPEVVIWNNLNRLNEVVANAVGSPLFKGLVEKDHFLRFIHRFYGESFEAVCLLAKELHRAISEKINVDAINSQFTSEQQRIARDNNYRQIRRLDLWLTGLGFDGRELTKVLSAVNDLRQGDAHATGSSLRGSLPLLGIAEDSMDYPRMCWEMLAEVGHGLAAIGKSVQTSFAAGND